MNLLDLFNEDLISSVLRSLIPILLAALGGMLAERVGIFNIGLEGMLLVGAFAGVAASYFTHNWVVGVIVAMLAGMLFSLILGYGAVYRKGDPIVLAIAMNILAVGMTSFLIVAVFDVQGVFQDPGIDGIPTWRIPFLADIPWIGALFALTPLGYLALLLVPTLWIVLFRTPLGLRMRGVGERPLAAATMGVNPQRYQLGAVLASGALAGLGGAQLALGNVVLFGENMSAGRGWIAVVVVMLARAHPVGVLGAALLFGFADAIGFRLQSFGLPQQLTDAGPYVLTLLVLILMSGRFRKTREAAVA
ncbi:ABC transporter permease [Leucobacter luti]|uniref:Nucleoside ABC transporter membrane protein n=1 Tax=Leucobacter luti TaxID=340320 RepID=A0A4R6SAH0_9MICO|nr:ABC transporter permease [Leucobacter luti]MCW2288518.1 simple sugar transport system permease protein [Leucobacter luti]QYM75545.1 ABC transporter permease [Leucobacter luti]TCK45326.1 nucleoside ABC transporter membrane protein [Leucobacter luti]TDP95855.1 nucleoside ABC transporter membrane protein [Leucobacter luti]